MKSEDRQFFNQFIEVIAILVLVAIGLYWLATALSDSDESLDDRRMQRAAVQLEPEAMVVTANIKIKQPEVEVKTRTGEEMFAAVGCGGCHMPGNAQNAPAVGDTAVWQARLAAAEGGLMGLVRSVQMGRGAMPALAASGSDQEFINAVTYLLGEAGIQVQTPGEGAAESAADTSALEPISEPVSEPEVEREAQPEPVQEDTSTEEPAPVAEPVAEPAAGS